MLLWVQPSEMADVCLGGSVTMCYSKCCNTQDITALTGDKPKNACQCCNLIKLLKQFNRECTINKLEVFKLDIFWQQKLLKKHSSGPGNFSSAHILQWLWLSNIFYYPNLNITSNTMEIDLKLFLRTWKFYSKLFSQQGGGPIPSPSICSMGIQLQRSQF